MSISGLRMRCATPILALLVGIALPGVSAPTEDTLSSDPFSIVADTGGLAVSLEDARTATGTPFVLTEYRGGRGADQILSLRPTLEPGWFYLVAAGGAGVMEVAERGGERAVVLAPAADRSGQKWQMVPLGPGRYRIVCRLGGYRLSAGGESAALTVAGPGEVLGDRWKLLLQPVLLDPGGPPTTLERQLDTNRETWIDPVAARQALTVYVRGGGPEMDKGLRILAQDRVYTLAPDERNYALTLFLWLLSRGTWEAGDTITVALALANASLYAEGDDEVRSRLRADVLEHYELYRALKAWQDGWAIRYRLGELPLLAKVLWSYRANQLQQDGHTLTLDEYDTFVDRIDVLREMHQHVKSLDVGEAATLRGVVANLDRAFQGAYKYAHFMAMIRQWYTPDAPLPQNATDDELYHWLTRPEVTALLPAWVPEVLEDYRSGRYYVEVLGRRRDPQARIWVNYQWQLHRDTGYFRGDCGTEAEVSMALWKAAGIAAMAVYHTGKDIGHAYPMYYDPFVGRYLGLQDLGYMRAKFGDGAAVTVHPMPLRIHDRLPPLAPRPTTTVGPYARFVARGMDYEIWETLFLNRGTAPAGIFAAPRIPEALPDRDGDGLLDEDEIRLGTAANRADTDGDGFTDAWEVERGFDPEGTASPDRVDLGRVLVGHVVRIASIESGAGLRPPGTGDDRPLYRIVRSDESQVHFLVSAVTGLALTRDPGGGLAETPLTGSATQRWKLLYREGGSFVIQSRADLAVVAATAGNGLETREPRGTPDERWVIR